LTVQALRAILADFPQDAKVWLLEPAPNHDGPGNGSGFEYMEVSYPCDVMVLDTAGVMLSSNRTVQVSQRARRRQRLRLGLMSCDGGQLAIAGAFPAEPEPDDSEPLPAPFHLGCPL